MPEARPTIEREKIRHRRPNDLRFDDGEAPVSRQSHLTDDVDHGSYTENTRYQDVEDDWTAEGEGDQETAAWDDEPEDDWVLDGDDGGHGDEVLEAFDAEEDAHIEFAEESGVVWEEGDFPVEHAHDSPDEMSFGPQSKNFGFAPEVELAGRRDVRPKAPRPAPAPSARAPAQPQRRQRSPKGRQPQPDWDASGEPVAHQPSSRTPVFEPRQRPSGPTHAEDKRFSRTRAVLGAPAGAVAGGLDEEVLEQPRSGPPQRRRQAQPAPTAPRATRRNAVRRKGHGKGLIAIVLLVLLAGGGWFTYQSIGPDGVRSMLDRLSALVPLPGSSRTAADTSFGDQDGAEVGSASAEQAISDLEQRIRQQEGGEGDSARASPAAGADGPPIPQFKPLPGASRSLAVDIPAGAVDDAQLAANEDAASDEEPTNALSIFEQLWRYLSPG